MEVVKVIVLGLLFSFAAGQVVSWADCCCGTFCEHKGACTGCGDERDCAQKRPGLKDPARPGC